MTNRERLMAMNDEELALRLDCPYIPGESGALCKTFEEQERLRSEVSSKKCQQCITQYLGITVAD